MKIFEKTSAGDFQAETLKRRLWKAVTDANVYEVNQAIKKGARPNEDMLTHAVGAKKADLAHALMEHGVKPHSGMMFIALNNQDEKMVAALIQHNVHPAPDDPGPRREYRPL